MTETNAIEQYVGAPLEVRQAYAAALAQAGELIPKGLHDQVYTEGPNNTRLAVQGQTRPNPGKVLLAMEYGAMLGLHPIAAVSGINVIEGKATASSGLMSGVIRGAGHRLEITEEGTVEGGDYKAIVTLTRADEGGTFRSVWSPQRAARAGLCTYTLNTETGQWRVTARSERGNRPLPWELYTESLCKARGISEVARDGAQDLLFGIRYTPEELGHSEEYVVGEPVEQTEAPAAEPAAPSAKPRKTATNGRQGTRRKPKAEEAAPEPTEEPTEEPAEEIHEAELVEEPTPDTEPPAATEPEPEHIAGETPDEMDARIKAERAARKAAADAASRPEYDRREDETEQQYQWRKHAEQAEREEQEARAAFAAEQEARLAADEMPGTEETLPVEVEQPAAPDESEYAQVTAMTPDDYQARLAAATTEAQCQEVYDHMEQLGKMTTDVRLAVVKRRGHIRSGV